MAIRTETSHSTHTQYAVVYTQNGVEEVETFNEREIAEDFFNDVVYGDADTTSASLIRHTYSSSEEFDTLDFFEGDEVENAAE